MPLKIMGRIMIGCLVGILGLMNLTALRAQDSTPVAPPEPQILIELTPAFTPTIETSLTPDFTLTILSTMTTPEVSPASTQVVPQEATAEIMTPPESIIILPVPDVSVTMSSSQILIPTMTATLILRSIQGQVLYPTRVLGEQFIQVRAFALDNTLLSTAYPDANGLYSLLVGAHQITRVEIDVPLYLSETLYLRPALRPHSSYYGQVTSMAIHVWHVQIWIC